MSKILSIHIDGHPHNVIIIPEHWSYNQSQFENADVYLVVDAQTERPLATICFSEDKTEWEINSELDCEAQDEIVSFIKSQSPLTAL